MVEFLDTNPIIRYVTKANPQQAEQSRILFQEIEGGKRVVTTCEGLIVEAVQVLESPRNYRWPREKIRDYLSTLLYLGGFRIPYKPTYLRALDLYASTGIDFVDALSVAHMERAEMGTILSFDAHFDKITGITRKDR